MKKLFVSLATLASLLVSPVVAGAQVSPEAPVEATPFEMTVAQVQPSIVFLDITWTGWVYDKYNKNYLNDGQPFTLPSYCSGFVVDPDGTIATAGHCVDPQAVVPDFLDIAAAWALRTDYYVGGNTFQQVRRWAADDYRIEGAGASTGGADTVSGGEPLGADLEVQAVWSTSSTEPVYDENDKLNGTPYGARMVGLVPWNDGAGDTAILQVDAPEPLVALPLAASEDITTGTDIVSVGYPASVGNVSDTSLSNPSFKEGSISSVRTTGLYPVYETSASLSGGMSGGPTVNLQGEVVGINSFGIVGETDTFEFIQAIATLDDLLGDEGIDAEVGEPGTSYRVGLDAYFAGNKPVAVREFSQAVATSPDFDMASEYLAKAKALPAPPEPESGLPIVPIAATVAVLALIAGGLFFLQQRKKKGQPEQGQPDQSVSLPAPPEAVTEAVTEPVTEAPTAPILLETKTIPDGDASPTTGWYCSNCGNHMDSSIAKFCSRCGQSRPMAESEKHRRRTV